MEYLYIKALHIIFMVTWFAGLFYVVRLFIYHVEAENKEDATRLILQNQYKLMEKRLWYIITWPSGVITSICGFYLLYVSGYYTQTWMLVKLSFIIALFVYHGICHKIYKQLQNNVIKYSATQLRIWNEVATIILFSVVFLVILKNAVSWVWGVVGIVLVSVLLMLMVKVYKNMRQKKKWENPDQ